MNKKIDFGSTADRWANTKRDKLFQSLFSRMMVYTILLEDSEVDDRFFGVSEDSSVLTIAGAGCGVAGLAAKRPRRIDVVDSNRHHLAITSLKLAAARGLPHYGNFYDLLARGWSPFPRRQLEEIAHLMPRWAARYWNRRARLLRSSLYNHGLMARSFAAIRTTVGTDESWMRRVSQLSLEERLKVVERDYTSVLSRPAHAAIMRSPLLLLSQGVNYVQRERNLVAHETDDMLQVVQQFLRRIAVTDLEHNWIAWNATVGHFNHEKQEAVPPYLRQAQHERSLGAPTDIEFHHGNIFERLRRAGGSTWSHYNVSDTIDWMPKSAQLSLFEEVRRTARPGATLLLRSVESGCLMERLGLDQKFIRIEPACSEGTRDERSRLYRWTGFYRVS